MPIHLPRLYSRWLYSLWLYLLRLYSLAMLATAMYLLRLYSLYSLLATAMLTMAMLTAAMLTMAMLTAAVLTHQALQHDNRTLRALELSHNPLGRKGTGVIMASLADNLHLTSVGLQHTMAGLDGVRDKMAHGEASGAGASLDFDAQRPEGDYSLDLGKPWERWVACKLQQLALQQTEPWENCSYDDGRTPHFSRHSAQLWSEKLEVPTTGHLRLRYRSTQPVEQSLVHYSLDLADPAQREVLGTCNHPLAVLTMAALTQV